jgi:hypothetical protein
MSLTSKDKFAGAAQEIALGKAVSSISGNIKVEQFENGLIVERGGMQIKIDTTAGLIGIGDKVSPLRTTNSRGENDAFEQEVIGAHRYGKSSGTPEFAAYATDHKALVRRGNNQFVLIKDLNDGSYGVALMKDNTLSAGEIQAPGASPKTIQSLDRDMSPLTPAMI